MDKLGVGDGIMAAPDCESIIQFAGERHSEKPAIRGEWNLIPPYHVTLEQDLRQRHPRIGFVFYTSFHRGFLRDFAKETCFV